MKRTVFNTLAVISLLAVLLSSTTIPVLANGPSIEYVDSIFMPGKGYVFKFSVNGTFEEKDLTGYLVVSQKTFDLSCKNNDGALICTTDPGLAVFSGKTAQIVVAGYQFYITIDSRKNCLGYGLINSDNGYKFFTIGTTRQVVKRYLSQWSDVTIESGYICQTEEWDGYPNLLDQVIGS